MSLHHPNSFKLCGTQSYWGSYNPADRCRNQTTNSSKQKHCHLCPGIADANWTQQKVCKSHSSDRNLIQCFHCNLVSVKLFLCVPCRHSGEWSFSNTHTHTLNLSTTVNGHEWSASCQEAGWEPELAWAIWCKEKSLPLPGTKLWFLSCQTCGLLNVSTMLSQLCLIPASTKSCRMHTAANFINYETKKSSQIIQDSRALRCTR